MFPEGQNKWQKYHCVSSMKTKTSTDKTSKIYTVVVCVSHPVSKLYCTKVQCELQKKLKVFFSLCIKIIYIFIFIFIFTVSI